MNTGIDLQLILESNAPLPVPDSFDFLSFELASWSRFHGHSEKSDLNGTHAALSALSFEDCMTAITSNIVYDKEKPGRHIS